MLCVCSCKKTSCVTVTKRCTSTKNTKKHLILTEQDVRFTLPFFTYREYRIPEEIFSLWQKMRRGVCARRDRAMVKERSVAGEHFWIKRQYHTKNGFKTVMFLFFDLKCWKHFLLSETEKVYFKTFCALLRLVDTSPPSARWTFWDVPF